jgi:hypothetical protein
MLQLAVTNILRGLVDEIHSTQEEVAFYRKLIDEAEALLASPRSTAAERERVRRALPAWRHSYSAVLEYMYNSCTTAEKQLLETSNVNYLEVFKLRKTAFKCMNEANLLFY